MNPTYDFTGRRVLVTGGARGLGRAIVEKFYKAGAKVIVLSQNEVRLQKLKEELPNVETCQVDLRNWEATQKAVESVLPIHHLVNNAGVPAPYSCLEINSDQLDEIFNVNHKAVVNVSQVVAKEAIKNGLENVSIVNLSSIADRVALTGLASAYNSTKAALTMLTKSMAAELADHKIRVNCVRPGVVPTDLLSHYPEDVVKAMVPLYMQRVPGGHEVTPDEVAQTIMFLSSPAASGINGTSVTIDGGFEIQ